MKATDIIAEAKEILLGEDALVEDCRVISPIEESDLLQQIIVEMKETMRVNNLKYLTAPQIGYNYRVFCICFGESDYCTYVNPMEVMAENLHPIIEKCNSFPGMEFLHIRPGKVTLQYLTPLGDPKSCDQYGVAAELVDHCIQHLDGGLCSDIGVEIDELWYKATDEERNEVLLAYTKEVEAATKVVEEAIENDEELKKIVDATKFIESVIKGETILSDAPVVDKSANKET